MILYPCKSSGGSPVIEGNATPSNVSYGKTFMSNNSPNVQTGTMPNKKGSTVEATTVVESGNNVLITVPQAGEYDTASKLQVAKSLLPTGSGNYGRTAFAGMSLQQNTPHSLSAVGSCEGCTQIDCEVHKGSNSSSFTVIIWGSQNEPVTFPPAGSVDPWGLSGATQIDSRTVPDDANYTVDCTGYKYFGVTMYNGGSYIASGKFVAS